MGHHGGSGTTAAAMVHREFNPDAAQLDVLHTYCTEDYFHVAKLSVDSFFER